MNFFTTIKKAFKKKVVNGEQNIEDEPKPDYSHLPICSYCKTHIHTHEARKTWQNKKYHIKPCYRSVMKEAKRMLRNNDPMAIKYMATR